MKKSENGQEAAWAPQSSVIYVEMEPGGIKKIIKRPKTARQLLEALNLDEEAALVARESKLLTPDRHIWPGERIWVRVVGSRG